MDIQQTIAPAPAPLKPQAADHNEPLSHEQNGEVASSAFSQLLQGLNQPNPLQALQMLSIDGVQAGADAQLLSLDAVGLGQMLVVDEALLLDGALNFDSLVGQTQHLEAEKVNLDIQADRNLVVDVPLASSWMAGQGWGTQPHIAAGQQVATVAAGVQPAPHTVVLAETQTAMAAASAVLAQASDVVDAAPQSVVDGLLGDSASEGRIALHGAWKLDEPQLPMNPTFLRVMGQVEQWAAASAGLQPKPNERAENGKSVAMTADLLAAGQGSGTRLTENAVKEAQQAQDAVFDGHNDAPVQDMRFWLQGKNQRAEVVLEKDGQPVRVQVALRGNEAHVTFTADQAQTRDMLDASLSQLREMLEQQGVALTGVSVQAQARGDTSSQEQKQPNPWDAVPVQHGQVVVPEAETAATHRTGAQGLDLYV